ncbi:Patatin [Gloeothece citriformis PCC 7424]|uniref:Patatin n=1 Tax=Gloeothece citriformis (strain PCC 7424) TaxID=65393 RepID=B7K8M7_GLOC7|nr:patatin-like phospholipase family protein [Gloeothece citriformis]ACK71225.1 Patatin [Gloeothece citriformis PCC 7424]
MNKTKIAIACQGGGSQTAFTAGVLRTFFKNKLHHQKQIVSLSGTSGGAVCASLAWYGLLKMAQGDTTPIEDRIGEFWQELTAQSPLEIFFDKFWVESIRIADRGFFPRYEMSPSSPVSSYLATRVASFLPRNRFTNFKGILEDFINFEELETLIKPDSPALLIGAANVLKGDLKTFSSYLGEMCVEAILASAAVPSLFPAVKVGEDYYWDGLFSDNPPLDELIRPKFVGMENIPDEIWIIQINPLTRKTVPTTPEDITDRRNEMVGNVSLLQDLEKLKLINEIIELQGFSESFLVEVGYARSKPFKIHIIEMSEALQERLDYASKLSRDPYHIKELMEDGKKQAEKFLETMAESVS